ncbi:MAG TPA: cysteine methyltransferase [Planctomycetaceae bacterium]|nr:cysteine methyltransferase [Planctomycetaceae bacterium]HRF00351.1 MGMT family protein [Pirellulaceae bacterium]
MPKSPNFIRIKADVLRLVAKVPRGRVTTYGAIGLELDVMARHVAYILAMLTDDEADEVPWHRVVGQAGLLKPTRLRPLAVRRALLEAEGIRVGDDDRVETFEQVAYSFS